MVGHCALAVSEFVKAWWLIVLRENFRFCEKLVVGRSAFAFSEFVKGFLLEIIMR